MKKGSGFDLRSLQLAGNTLPVPIVQAGMSIGHKGMLYAARCMAEGTKLLLENPDKLTAAWEEFKNTDA